MTIVKVEVSETNDKLVLSSLSCSLYRKSLTVDLTRPMIYKHNKKVMNENLKEILTKNISAKSMTPIWFPKDWQKVIVRRAEKEGLPVYKYVMMLSNNSQILKDERNTKN